MPYSRHPGGQADLKGEKRSPGRVMLNLRMGRAEVRDDLLLDYLLDRVPHGVAEAIKARAAIDPLVSRRIDELRSQLLKLSSLLSDVDDGSLSPEWYELLRQVGRGRK